MTSSYEKLITHHGVIRKQTATEFAQHLQFFYDGISLIIDASEILESLDKITDHATSEGASKTAAWRFLSTLPTSSIWCCESALTGDYAVAKNLLRLCLEEFIKLAYYVTFPDKALRQVAADRDKDEVNLADMLEQLDFPQRKMLMKLHGDLSAFYAHANLNLPHEILFDETSENPSIGGGPRFMPEIFEAIIQQLLVIVANTLKYTIIRFPKLVNDGTWMGTFETYVLEVVKLLPD